jgi:hypothetical protein
MIRCDSRIVDGSVTPCIVDICIRSQRHRESALATPHIDETHTVDSEELIFEYEYLCGFEAKMEQVSTIV